MKSTANQDDLADYTMCPRYADEAARRSRENPSARLGPAAGYRCAGSHWLSGTAIKPKRDLAMAENDCSYRWRFAKTSAGAWVNVPDKRARPGVSVLAGQLSVRVMDDATQIRTDF